MIQKRLIIIGRVQDVDYRETVKDIARDMSILGEVRNLKNGSVEISCECKDRKQLDEFEKKITVKEQSHHKPYVEKIDEYPEYLKLSGIFTIDYGDLQNQLLKKTIIGSKSMKSMDAKMGSMDTEMKSMNKNLGNKLDSLNNNITNQFNTMEEKYGEISKNLKEINDNLKPFAEFAKQVLTDPDVLITIAKSLQKKKKKP